MKTKEVEKIVKQYFEYFNDADLESLSEMYADNIKLIDWNGKWKGREEVLHMNKELFSDNNIFIEVKYIQITGHHVYCSILIKVNGESINAMDVISVNYDEKIHEINAYRQ